MSYQRGIIAAVIVGVLAISGCATKSADPEPVSMDTLVTEMCVRTGPLPYTVKAPYANEAHNCLDDTGLSRGVIMTFDGKHDRDLGVKHYKKQHPKDACAVGAWWLVCPATHATAVELDGKMA